VTTFGGHTIPPLFGGAGGGGSGGDPVGIVNAWSVTSGSGQFNTTNGIIFNVGVATAELVAGRVGQMVAFNRNQPAGGIQFNYTSTDGLNWVFQNNAPGNIWDQLPSARPATLFWLQVAGLWFLRLEPINGTVYFTSPDGIAWTQRAFPGLPSGISEGGYMTDGVDDFVLTRNNNRLWATQDGINWSNRGAQNGCSEIMFEPNLTPSYWCFGTSFGNANVRSSVTGTVGSFSDNFPSENSLNASAITFNQPITVARSRNLGISVLGLEVGGGGSSPAIQVHSFDNVNWIDTPLAARGLALRYSGTLGGFVSQQNTFGAGSQNISLDGINWNTTQYSAFAAPSGFYSADLLTSF